jgi:hypothetical protein
LSSLRKRAKTGNYSAHSSRATRFPDFSTARASWASRQHLTFPQLGPVRSCAWVLHAESSTNNSSPTMRAFATFRRTVAPNG